MYNYLDYLNRHLINAYVDERVAGKDKSNDIGHQRFTQWLERFESCIGNWMAEGIKRYDPDRQMISCNLSHQIVDQKGICFLITIKSKDSNNNQYCTHIGFYICRHTGGKLSIPVPGAWVGKYLTVANYYPDPYIQKRLGDPKLTVSSMEEFQYHFSFMDSLFAVVTKIVRLLEAGQMYQLEVGTPETTIIDLVTGS